MQKCSVYSCSKTYWKSSRNTHICIANRNGKLRVGQASSQIASQMALRSPSAYFTQLSDVWSTASSKVVQGVSTMPGSFRRLAASRDGVLHHTRQEMACALLT